MSRWMDDGVEQYLTRLAESQHADPVLDDMEARAAEHGFPIVGRATGRYLELAARSIGDPGAIIGNRGRKPGPSGPGGSPC